MVRDAPENDDGDLLAMKPATIYYVRADGSVEAGRDQVLTLEEMQAFVGGQIQVVPIVFNKIWSSMILNEEGKLRGFPVNITASMLYQRSNRTTGDFIVGDVLIVEGGIKDEAP
jgi:hypothetical protein